MIGAGKVGLSQSACAAWRDEHYKRDNLFYPMTQVPESGLSHFMLLFRNAGHATHEHLTTEEKAMLTQKWNDWYDGLAKDGKVQHGHPLGLDGRVVTSEHGRVVDGPFAESKEAIGGYFFLEKMDLNEATEIAKGCPGLPLGLVVEVRPVAAVSPMLENVRGRHARE
jgi:hypothetical protein